MSTAQIFNIRSDQSKLFYCWLIFCLLISSPSLLQLYLKSPAASETLAVSIAACLFLTAMLPLSWFFLLLLPVLWLIPLELLHLSLYQKVSDIHLIGIIADTNAAEAGWFLRKWFWQLSLLLIACTSLAIVGARLAYRVQWRFALRLRILLGFPMMVILLLHLIINISTGFISIEESERDFSPRFSHAFSGLTQSFMPGFVLRLYEYEQQQQQLQYYKQQLQNFSFDATRKIDAQEEVYVVVIGETTRMHNLQLNGYARPTTPRLSERNGLVSFTNLVSAWSWTRMAVPTIVTRKPASSKQVYFAEPSIVTLFKQAGFQTYWFSVQSPVGLHDSPVSLYALEADEYKFINPTDYQSQGAYDTELLPLLQQALTSSAQKKLVVLHTLGSHYRYSDRYPPEFEEFTPSIRGSNLGLHDRQARELLLNSYDNSILFLDFFLEQVIQQLEQTQAVSAMWYISDHGEVLFDLNCPISGHGHNSAYDHLPANFVWLSPKLQQRQPKALLALEKHKKSPLTSSYIFDSLAALAQIDYASARAEMNLLSDKLQFNSRILMNGVDFDQGAIDPLCQQRQHASSKTSIINGTQNEAHPDEKK